MACFNILSQYLYGETEEKHENQDVWSCDVECAVMKRLAKYFSFSFHICLETSEFSSDYFIQWKWKVLATVSQQVRKVRTCCWTASAICNAVANQERSEKKRNLVGVTCFHDSQPFVINHSFHGASCCTLRTMIEVAGNLIASDTNVRFTSCDNFIS